MKVCPRCSETYPDDVSHCTRDGAVLTTVADPLLGRTIGGRYRLISRLGDGGMSQVYLARHVMIDRLVAIKTLRSDLAQDRTQRDRFLREARAVNRIIHENIVEITDVGETEDGLAYLIMEYVPGQALRRALEAGPLEVDRALDITAQIASGLSRAHQMGVIHRDLKPENILLVQSQNRPDFVKVLDFGIAKILDAPALTGSQQLFGTPGYIAPEHIQSTHIDGRADLYSLGAMLYEMVTGSLPFDCAHPTEFLVKHLSEDPVPPRARVPSLPAPVEALILRALQKNPEDRFRDGFHFLTELAYVRDTLKSSAEPQMAGSGLIFLDQFRTEAIPEAPKVLAEVDAGTPFGSSVDQESRAARFSARLDNARDRTAAIARAREIPTAISEALVSAERDVAALVDGVLTYAELESRTDMLDTEARALRTGFGVRFDDAAARLSNARGEAARLTAARDELRKRREAALVQRATDATAEELADSLLWGLAATDEALRETLAQAFDLERHLEALRREFEDRDHAIDRDIRGLFDQLRDLHARIEPLSENAAGALKKIETWLAQEG